MENTGKTPADKLFEKGAYSPKNLPPIKPWTPEGSKKKLGLK